MIAFSIIYGIKMPFFLAILSNPELNKYLMLRRKLEEYVYFIFATDFFSILELKVFPSFHEILYVEK